jgi:hypothetical protein
MWNRVLQTKTMPTFTAYLLEPPYDGKWGIGIQRPNSVTVWEGLATFPWVMRSYAVRRFNDLERDTDIEDLMREWGTEAEFEDFQRFMSEEWEHNGLR